jgi:hypothetical protein
MRRGRALAAIPLLAMLALATGVFPFSAADETAPASQDTTAEPETQAEFTTETIRGRIVWLVEAMQRQHGIHSVPEAAESVLALESADGQLCPLVEDIRGRAFRRDERLRALPDCELLVRRYHGCPMVRVLRVFSHSDGQKYELDYYCDVCAITMFELKACECCQDPIELRRRLVTEAP